MKRTTLVAIFLILGMLLGSCGVIPTLPALDSTVTIKTPQYTIAPGGSEDTGQVTNQESTEIPAESPSASPDTVCLLPQPTESGKLPTETEVSAPQETLAASATSEVTEPTQTPISYPYTVQVMNPHYLGNFTHPDLGCNWLGIGGQVFDVDGVVQKNVIIKVGGDLNGSPIIEEMTMPLAEPEIDIAYGPGGYEITLADAPADSDSTVWIQLYSLDGNPLSDQIYLVTYDDCSKNLLLMNFVEE